jgi:hypothetical protein
MEVSRHHVGYLFSFFRILREGRGGGSRCIRQISGQGEMVAGAADRFQVRARWWQVLRTVSGQGEMVADAADSFRSG